MQIEAQKDPFQHYTTAEKSTRPYFALRLSLEGSRRLVLEILDLLLSLYFRLLCW